MEIETFNLLSQNEIIFNRHCDKNIFIWLKRQHLDFYLPQYNIAIECQGEQHFKPIDHFGGQEKLEYTQQMDTKKKQLCEENGVKLYYINYNDDVETKLNEILKENAIYKVT
jgi:very-short-patch-repair endonuclease